MFFRTLIPIQPTMKKCISDCVQKKCQYEIDKFQREQHFFKKNKEIKILFREKKTNSFFLICKSLFYQIFDFCFLLKNNKKEIILFS